MNKNNVEDIYQLSPMQQGMLFHTLYAPSSGVYCSQFGCAFTGSLDVEAFNAAWQQVVARHVALRTAFIWERQDVPLQVVYRQVKLPIDLHCWLELSPDEQQQQLQAFLESDRHRGFQLTKAPLMRLTLIQMSPDVYQFVWSYHHILLDGWSLPLVLTEVLNCYQALSVGEELHLPPSRSYREYIAWLQKHKLEVAEQFWRQTLHGVTAPTPLVIDKPQHNLSLQQSYSEHCLTLSTEVTSSLVSFARQHQLTLNTLVQATWALLLSRYSGETNVVFGVTVSGRSPAIAGVESIVGLFINTLPMRVEVSDEDTVLLKLKQIHKQQVELSTYEYASLVQIQRWSDVPRGLPLFESIVVFENYPVDAALQEHSQKLHISDVRAIGRNNYPLTVIAQPGVQLSLRFMYDSQRFDTGSVTRMVGHFQTLLQGLVANPDQKLSHIPLLSAAEQNQILVEWNKTQALYPQDLCLHQLFEQQVHKIPNAVAVVFEDQSLTYSELNTKANQLAHYLLSWGVGPEVLVGVCLERSLSMVVALLGILKAGGAYVPMDPEYPQERLAYMLSDSQVKVLLTEEKFLDRLAQPQAHLVCLDSNWQQISQFSPENPRTEVLPHHLAYAIYTSGSTGKPKGAMNTHYGVCNRLLWMQQAYQITADDHILQKTPFSFDVSVWEFFWPLIAGARLVVAQPGGHRDSAYLVKLIAQHQITTLHFVPSMLQVFLEEQDLESCASLRQVFCSGEALPKELQEKFFARLRCSLHNLYGPTEAAIDVTYWQCQPDCELLSVPIGRAIANTQIYILDRYNQPVPVGVAGELHISGAGLARGYLNRPELTAEKFIPNPFYNSKFKIQNSKWNRLYKTGDLARYLSDGNIEYLGRIDHQVKIRGFRIELGEIEAVLSQHPNVQQTVVIATQEVVGSQRLVAYLVANQQPAPQSGELRAFLKQKLPEYMLPSAYVVLDALPLTPNGKLDRKALPNPESAQSELETTFVAPRTPTEEVLAQIWTQVLRLERVGANDNFFDLGGHSLTATQLVFRVRNTFKLELPLHALLETPTVAAMAEAIDLVRDSKPTAPATISAKDLNKEAVLDDTIRPLGVAVEHTAQPARIFLTGATGFLGAFLLSELLQQTDADIYCLVRCSNVEEGKKKIQANLESYSLWNECFSSRIIPVIGDLSEPLFGLGDQQFQLLASTIDVIYHNGALVNFVDPYPKLKAANVLGTQEVLRLASQIKLKPVHYISTISVFPWEEGFSKEHIFRENDSLDLGNIGGGYEQSKWVAEKLVTIARTRGLPVCIYRPGRVSGHSQTGTSNTNDLMARMIKGCIQLGSIPDFNMTVDLTPVDYASRCIVHLSMQKKFLGETFHVVNPHPAHWSNVITWFRSFGYSLQVISYDKWRADLLKVAEHSSENALYPLIPFFAEEAPDDSVTFDCQNTLRGLAETSINCPSVSGELLSTYLSYYIRSGFLHAPQQIEQVEYSLNKAPEAITR